MLSTETASYWDRLKTKVIDPGNCMHCGACVGLNPGLLEFRETPRGPLPSLKRALNEKHDESALKLAWSVCPGRGIPYPDIFKHLNGSLPESMVLGPHREVHTGHATDPFIRRNGASGGVITACLVELLRTGKIDGVVVLQQGHRVPDRAEPLILTDPDEVARAAQSVYAVTPLLTILPEIEKFDGRLALVGLPEQVSTLRMLQVANHPAANKVKYVLGPFTGTNMYFGAVNAFLRMNGVKGSFEIEKLEWRAGEWPGELRVRLKDGQVFSAEKFYYNYLIPFFISRNCQLTPDFSNELTDISIGDAWSPKYESQRGGYSLVVCRTEAGQELVRSMHQKGLLWLEDLSPDELITMHSHMFDFKKRGTFIRLERQRRAGLPVPEYGYWPSNIMRSRYVMESITGALFWFGRQRFGQWLVQKFSPDFMGRIFSIIRVRWKNVSRPTRRRGLLDLSFFQVPSARWNEIIKFSRDG